MGGFSAFVPFPRETQVGNALPTSALFPVTVLGSSRHGALLAGDLAHLVASVLGLVDRSLALRIEGLSGSVAGFW
jgi:hypothetical protein